MKTNTEKINSLFGTKLADRAGVDPNKVDESEFDPKTGKAYPIKGKPGIKAISKPAEVKK